MQSLLLLYVRQPASEVLSQVFANSDQHASTSTDHAAAETRLRQIVVPKLDWVRDVFGRHVEGAPVRLLDVGAGGGHFVEACRRAGWQADGYENSAASRAFARQAFGLELRADDFLASGSLPFDVDVVTMWGLLEYTPDPFQFLATARRILSPEGMLVVEVPRYDCLGTAIQAACPDGIARHMGPTSHVNCFSDSSLEEQAYLPNAHRIIKATRKLLSA